MFHKYTNIEADVEVVQLSTETSAEITKLLTNEAAKELLASLTVTTNEAKECNEFTFRYRSETVTQNLKIGDYLVKLNTGLLKVYTEAELNGIYKHSSQCEEGELEVTKKLIDALFERYNVSDIKDVAAKLSEAYDSETNTIIVDFTNLAVTDPTGMGEVLQAINDSTVVSDTTFYQINFGNTSDTNRNRFDLTGLQLIIGEINTLLKLQRKHINGLTFVGQNGAKSAVSTVVLDDDWVDYIADVRAITGMPKNSSVKR